MAFNIEKDQGPESGDRELSTPPEALDVTAKEEGEAGNAYLVSRDSLSYQNYG